VGSFNSASANWFDPFEGKLPFRRGGFSRFKVLLEAEYAGRVPGGDLNIIRQDLQMNHPPAARIFNATL
jgi:hypothetical protein